MKAFGFTAGVLLLFAHTSDSWAGAPAIKEVSIAASHASLGANAAGLSALVGYERLAVSLGWDCISPAVKGNETIVNRVTIGLEANDLLIRSCRIGLGGGVRAWSASSTDESGKENRTDRTWTKYALIIAGFPIIADGVAVNAYLGYDWNGGQEGIVRKQGPFVGASFSVLL